MVVNPTRRASTIVVSKFSSVSASVGAGSWMRDIALSTNTPARELMDRPEVKEARQTSRFSGVIAHDETTVDNVG